MTPDQEAEAIQLCEQILDGFNMKNLIKAV
jgi:hypothetical protein